MTLRPSLCEAEAHGDAQHIEPRVALVLVALAKAEGSVLSRDDLIARCWDGVIVGDDAINRIIGKIRRLAEGFEAGFAIETVPRVGYRLVRTKAMSPAPVRVTEAKSWAPADGAYWRAEAAEESVDPLVAVLAFDGTGDPAAASLAEGVSDCILSMLARDSGTAVVGRPDSFRFRGTSKSHAARSLGASHVVDGAVSVCGDDVRVTAFLIDGNAGVTLWSEQFRGSAADPFTLQARSALRVTEALRRNHGYA
ncbi:winged helix-turn-helix domain-containing protein [Brevundimonas lenta]|nr:winged helix-turn-helix domain-containing protein [Brevundimonas lenta]